MSDPYEILDDGRVAIDPTTWRPARSALFVFCHLMYPQDNDAELYQLLLRMAPQLGVNSQTLPANVDEKTLEDFLANFAAPDGTLKRASEVFSNLDLVPIAITAVQENEDKWNRKGEDE